MKKFLIFLVAIVVVVCVGLTTYYFLRNDEAINFSTKEIYVNTGDIITLDDLGYRVIKQHRKTTYDYNAGGDSVTALVRYDEDQGYYVVNDTTGGEVDIVINTSNENYTNFKIHVYIGDGTSEYPYYIENMSDIQKIGDMYSLDSSYQLRSNITLSSSFLPIGYNYTSNQYAGFTGSFDGNGFTISGLNLTGNEYSNAGLFSSLIGASVQDLTISQASVNGSYDNAGILAGRIDDASIVTGVRILDSSVTNAKANSNVGGLAGTITNNSSVSVSGVTNSFITMSSTAVSNSNVGGFAGIVDQSKVQATFADTAISADNGSTGNVAGFTGKFVIGTDAGSIQESYSITTSEYANFAGFIGQISSGTNFNNAQANQLTYLVGNYALTNGNNVVVRTNDLANTEDRNGIRFFERYYDIDNAIYFIVGYNSLDNMVSNSNYVFYAVDRNNLTLWDASAWEFVSGQMPTLKTENVTLSAISAEYMLKNLQETTVTNRDALLDILQTADNGVISDVRLVLASNIDLSGIDWTPYVLVNSIITTEENRMIEISNLTLAKSTDGNIGLFAEMDNSSISNIRFTNVRITASGTYAGTIAGRLVSSSSASASQVNNVQVEFGTGALTSQITTLGGIAGSVENGSQIVASTVSYLSVDTEAVVENAGAIAGRLVDGSIVGNENVTEISNVTLSANNRLGGVVAINNGTISNINGDVSLVYSENNFDAYVGGVVAENNANISNVDMNVRIDVNRANRSIMVGGATAVNNGNISEVKLSGAGIVVDETEAQNHSIGGISAVNNGTIDRGYNLMISIGTYIAGRNLSVGGITVDNNGTITNSIAGSNIRGNIVSGVTVNMTSADARVDGVLVAGFDPITDAVSERIISGDQYVAGVCYNFTAGEMTNIQTESNLVGEVNSTKTSLVVLIFPQEASISNVTVNSSVDGNGDFYRETWKDYADAYDQDHYNIYARTSASGRMTSVVINTERAGSTGKTLITGEFRFDIFNISSYANSENQNNVKAVNNTEFDRATTFVGTHTISDRGYWGVTVSYTRELTFNMNGTWTQDNGISLTFLSSVE